MKKITHTGFWVAAVALALMTAPAMGATKDGGLERLKKSASAKAQGQKKAAAEASSTAGQATFEGGGGSQGSVPLGDAASGPGGTAVPAQSAPTTPDKPK